MDELSQNSIIKIITFIGVVTLGQQKKNYHWLYLKETDPTFKKYDKEDDLYRDKGLDGKSMNSPFQLSTMGALLIPYFSTDKDEKLTDLANFYAKRIKLLIAITYTGIGALILEFIYLE
jgi:hypothetical protein